ncbi:hypothetical protein WKH71_05250 [Pantoea agglomerans]|uniref:hypothetical protein n=1 Tax=Enterobacter agglomerans TaxID=549 RepID=UPI003C7ACA06
MSIELIFFMKDRVPEVGIGFGEICSKKYSSLLEANLPSVGDEITLQHGTSNEQSSTWEVIEIQRTIQPDKEVYWIICKYLG